MSFESAGAQRGPGVSPRESALRRTRAGAITDAMNLRPARGGQNPTMDQVAAAAGVSRATVSRVINGAPSVDAKIREIVQRAIADTATCPTSPPVPRARRTNGGW